MTDEHPLYPTKEAACAAPGEIFQHYKGGVYRLVRRDVKHSETLEVGVVYEHLWPHEHGYWFRPESLFFGKLSNGEPRFRLIKKA
jgi:hypothetical protein